MSAEELTGKLRGSRNRIQEHGERGTITADRVINNAVQIGVRTSTDTGDQLGNNAEDPIGFLLISVQFIHHVILFLLFKRPQLDTGAVSRPPKFSLYDCKFATNYIYLDKRRIP